MLKLKHIIALSLGIAFNAQTLEVSNPNVDIISFYGENPKGANVSRFFASFPFEYSIKTKYGRGRNLMIEFLDPNCPYCAKQSKEFKDHENAVNATSYQFLVKINPDPHNITDYIWCTKDRSKALQDWYNLKIANNNVPTTKVEEWKKKHPEKENCKTPVEFNTNFFRTFLSDERNGQFYTSTPTTVFSNGMKAPNNFPIHDIGPIYKYVEQYPLEIPNFERLNSNETIEKIRFHKQTFLKEKENVSTQSN